MSTRLRSFSMTPVPAQHQKFKRSPKAGSAPMVKNRTGDQTSQPGVKLGPYFPVHRAVSVALPE
jgi:hypothetical protein